MSALQTIQSRPDYGAIGARLLLKPSYGVSNTSQLIESRLKDITSPSPTFSAEKAASATLEEQLYDALAAFKVRTATVAMHLDRDRRARLFKQLDSLLAIPDWEVNDLPPTIGSFATFLRMIMLLRPERFPGLGATTDGNLIAAWTAGDDRLTIECQPKDFVRWNLSATIEGERERSAAITPLGRLCAVLQPYDPKRWFSRADNLRPA
jgi:hypothetical protein